MSTRQQSRIFQYAILLHPLADNANDNPPPTELLVEPTCVLAPDQDKALIIAGRAIPEEYLERLDEVEIAVRPF